MIRPINAPSTCFDRSSGSIGFVPQSLFPGRSWKCLFSCPKLRRLECTTKTVENLDVISSLRSPPGRPYALQVPECLLKIFLFCPQVLFGLELKSFCRYRPIHCLISKASASENVSGIEFFIISAGVHKFVRVLSIKTNAFMFYKYAPLPIDDIVQGLRVRNGATASIGNGLSCHHTIVKKLVFTQIMGTASQIKFGLTIHHVIVANDFEEMKFDNISWFLFCLSI